MRSCSIHGPAMTTAANTATSLGMNESVASLICVAAWNMLTTRPAQSAVRRSGAEMISVSSSASRTIAITAVEFIWRSAVRRESNAEALRERSEQKVPAVHEDEEHDLEGQRDHDRRDHHHPH